MKKFNCYILDDEPLALNVIEKHLSKFGQFIVCGKSTEPIEALTQIKRLQPDLLFIDIQMPEITGLEFIASLQNKPQIIITTAYREYAVEGFELNVLDYLVKPIPFQRFMQAIDKFLEHSLPTNTLPLIEEESCIFVKANRKTVKILLDEILYVEGLKDYVKIILPKQKILTKVSIGNFFKDLPKDRFLQVHKSFVVAKNKITAYTAHDVEINELEIPIGRVYKERFLKEVEN
ncbi:MAG: DNA-binding response regulator [Saprospiraceae bacterium]|nr:MAG: DNA-binding response regulator [Saprospiraceae bacterium]